ncbi:tyrosine-type recombinase/integrase [Brevibacillus agri]|uniref:tyrosine-type recombinase/integrase n=1 Tax=Brevibacillus agri TaxID=51101 RepID=UPI003D2616A6
MTAERITVSEGIRLFLRKLSETKSENTVKSYKSDLDIFLRHLNVSWVGDNDGDILVQEITKTDLRDMISNWKSLNTSAPTSINRRIVAVKSFFKFLNGNGYVITDIAEDLSVKRIQKQNLVKWLTRQQVGRLLHVVENQLGNEAKKARDKVVFITLLNCGLRVNELCSLKLEDVNLQSHILTVSSGKGNKYRRLPLGNSTVKTIEHWLNFHPGNSEYLLTTKREPQMTTRAVQHLLKKYGEMAGVEVTPHTLRHTFCKNLADRTGKLEIVSELAGHTSIETTRIYVTPSLRELKDAVEGIEF